MTIGVLLIALSLFPIAHSATLWDSAFEVHSFGWYYYSTIFAPLTHLHLGIEVQQGSVDFIVMDEENFIKYNSSQAYQYYVAPYHPSATRADFQWIPPSSQRIYFVFDNRKSLSSKFVSALFSVESSGTLLPPMALYVGIGFLFVGLEEGIRKRQKQANNTPKDAQPVSFPNMVLACGSINQNSVNIQFP